MATIAIGDIHGNAAALEALLEHLVPGLSSADTVVFLGDYIDRGEDSRGCLNAIVELRAAGVCKVVCLRGNHEDWLLDTYADYTRHSWLLAMDGLVTVRSYSPAAEAAIRAALSQAGLAAYTGGHELPYGEFFDAMPESHRDLLTTLRNWYETTDCVCAHAGVDPAVAEMVAQPARALVWGVPQFPREYGGTAPVIYGHRNNASPGRDGWPVLNVVGETICVDTSKYGVVSAISMPARQVFQSDGTDVISYKLGER